MAMRIIPAISTLRAASTGPDRAVFSFFLAIQIGYDAVFHSGQHIEMISKREYRPRVPDYGAGKRDRSCRWYLPDYDQIFRTVQMQL